MQVRIANFQSILATQLQVDGLTVVIGPSNRGKSAAVRAIEGALFNRPGDGFVRVGAKTAEVDLAFDGHTVGWRKGGGLNEFTVDHVKHGRVGAKAPDVLAGLGFRDAVIGGRVKDDGKLDGGETVRPQVARQFDRIFLLDQPAAFINEVMVKLSRLEVLQRANRACSGDLRSAQSLLKVRQADVVKAGQAVTQLEPIVALRERVLALAARRVQVERQQARLQTLRQLAASRQQAVQRLGVTLPAVTSRSLPDPERLIHLRLLRDAADRAHDAIVKLPKRVKPTKKVVDAAKLYLLLKPLQTAAQLHAVHLASYGTDVEVSARAHTVAAAQLTALRAEVGICPVCERPF